MSKRHGETSLSMIYLPKIEGLRFITALFFHIVLGTTPHNKLGSLGIIHPFAQSGFHMCFFAPESQFMNFDGIVT